MGKWKNAYPDAWYNGGASKRKNDKHGVNEGGQQEISGRTDWGHVQLPQIKHFQELCKYHKHIKLDKFLTENLYSL